MKIWSRDNEPIKSLLKRFRRQCDKDGLAKDMKRHEYYESASQRKRRKRARALKNYIKEQQESQMQRKVL